MDSVSSVGGAADFVGKVWGRDGVGRRRRVAVGVDGGMMSVVATVVATISAFGKGRESGSQKQD